MLKLRYKKELYNALAALQVIERSDFVEVRPSFPLLWELGLGTYSSVTTSARRMMISRHESDLAFRCKLESLEAVAVLVARANSRKNVCSTEANTGVLY